MGVVILLYAMTMPVSVGDSGIVNIHLISERQNTLLFGGFLFLAGIVLFAVFKLKQTKEDVDSADKLQQERTEAAKSFLTGSDRGILSMAVRLMLGIVFGTISALLFAQLAFFAVAMATEEFVPAYVETLVTGVAAIAIIAYAFRKIPVKRVMIHFGVLALFAAVSIPVQNSLERMSKTDCNEFLQRTASGGSHDLVGGSEDEKRQRLMKTTKKLIFCAKI